MKYILTLLLLLSISLNADMMLKKSLGCPTIVALEKAPVSKQEDVFALSMYSIANDCIAITKRDKVEAIGYDPRNSQDIYQKIIYKKTGAYLYILRSAIQVEQGGKKGILRF